jgi:hypothetical protein
MTLRFKLKNWKINRNIFLLGFSLFAGFKLPFLVLFHLLGPDFFYLVVILSSLISVSVTSLMILFKGKDIPFIWVLLLFIIIVILKLVFPSVSELLLTSCCLLPEIIWVIPSNLKKFIVYMRDGSHFHSPFENRKVVIGGDNGYCFSSHIKPERSPSPSPVRMLDGEGSPSPAIKQEHSPDPDFIIQQLNEVKMSIVRKLGVFKDLDNKPRQNIADLLTERETTVLIRCGLDNLDEMSINRPLFRTKRSMSDAELSVVNTRANPDMKGTDLFIWSRGNYRPCYADNTGYLNKAIKAAEV